MNKLYTRLKCTLKSCQYNLELIEGTKTIEIDLRDTIEILTISENEIKLLIKREMLCGQQSSIFLTTTFDVVLTISNSVTKEEFIKNITDGLPILSNAFSRISLLISQITQLSPLGIIISPPSYDAKNLNII